MKLFVNVEAFYTADARRLHSGEVDFGVMWHEAGKPWPQYRVSWVEATGEFYSLRLGRHGSGAVELLGSTPPGDRAAADAALSGWAELDDSRLDWVRERLRHVTVYSVGPVHASVCYPAEMPLDELAAEVNRLAGPTGVGPWQPSEAAEFANGLPNPCPCEQTPGRLHRLFNC